MCLITHKAGPVSLNRKHFLPGLRGIPFLLPTGRDAHSATREPMALADPIPTCSPHSCRGPKNTVPCFLVAGLAAQSPAELLIVKWTQPPWKEAAGDPKPLSLGGSGRQAELLRPAALKLPFLSFYPCPLCLLFFLLAFSHFFLDSSLSVPPLTDYLSKENIDLACDKFLE